MGYKIELEESRRYHILKALMCLFIEKPFQVVGAAGFFIYLSHLFVLSVLKALIGDSFSVYFATYFLLPPVVITVLLGVFYFMRRFMPGRLGILTGRRRPVSKNS